MKRLLLVLFALAAQLPAEVDLNRALPEVTLKDGRVLREVAIVGYSEHAVMARWAGDQGTLAYADLPVWLNTAIDHGNLRPIPKPKPQPPPAPAPVVAVPPVEQPHRGTLVQDLKPGSRTVLHGRRQGSQLFLRVNIEANGGNYLCECLVDTGATMTTVAKAQVPLEPTGRNDFTTANGQISMPFTKAAVTVGDITKEIGVAVAPTLRVNLLGANFFEDFVYTIDLENGAMYLVKR